jgi:hypothetical protein
MTSKWRDTYKVHPAADVFPMMSDEELDALGQDIKANGQSYPVVFTADGTELVDGRNRLEAAERAGLPDTTPRQHGHLDKGVDPVAFIIGANIRRRHLTKQQQADLIVAALKASRQVGEVPKRHVNGKAGSEKDPVKAAAVAAGAEHGISERTVERAIAKADGRAPKAKPPVEGSDEYERDRKECIALYQKASEADREAGGKSKPKDNPDRITKLDIARANYIEQCKRPNADLDGELELVRYAFKLIAEDRRPRRASA